MCIYIYIYIDVNTLICVCLCMCVYAYGYTCAYACVHARELIIRLIVLSIIHRQFR